MPSDPNLPQAGTDIDAVEMRGQLNGLHDLIIAINAIIGQQNLHRTGHQGSHLDHTQQPCFSDSASVLKQYPCPRTVPM